MNREYNRYSFFLNSKGEVEQPPFIKIPVSPTDKYVNWKLGISRFDKLAQSYYDDPRFDWIILYGNPEYLSEFDIPDNSIIRIPFPIHSVKEFYEKQVNKILKL